MVVTWPIRLRVCDLVVCYVGSAARFLCRVLWVSTRRGMLVAAMVLVVVCDTDLRSSIGPRIVIAINHGTPRKEPRDEHHGD